MKVTCANTSRSDLMEEVPASAGLKLARSEGQVEVGFKQQNNTSCLRHLYQSGCGRVRFPSVDHPDMPEAVLINTAGGLTGGDKMRFEIVVDEEARLTVTGQAAEKIYKSIGPEVSIEAHLAVKSGGYLEWLPQETILFEKAKLRRLNKVELSSGSTFLAVEATVLGRRASGEALRNAHLIDGWKIWQNGKLVWFDQFRLNGNMDELLLKPALLDGATSFATLVLVTEDAEKYVQLARNVADECASRIGVSSFDANLTVIRLMDSEAYSLRQSLVTLLIRLRNELAGATVPMPAVWEV